MTYYNKIHPKIDDVVFITVNKLSNAGTYCNLIEYNLLEGFILNTELDRWNRVDKRQVRISDQKKFKDGQIYCARVLALNVKTVELEPNIKKEEIYSVDLSYKKIAIDLREQLVNNFGYIARIKQLCDEFVFVYGLPTETIYASTIWQIKFDSTVAKEIYYDLLKHPETFVEKISEIYPEAAINFVQNMKSRITYTKMTIEQPFELIIYDTDAMAKLQQILTYGDDGDNTFVECVSSPKYKIITSCHTLIECNDNITKCFETLKLKALKFKAVITLKPRKNTDGQIDDIGIVKHQEVYIRNLNMQSYT